MKKENFLRHIRDLTAARIREKEIQISLSTLQSEMENLPPTLNFLSALQRKSHVSIIAEVKRRSPSRGEIASDLSAIEIASAYKRAGAAAISVLTEPNYFGGSIDDLSLIRSTIPEIPLLMKDFVISEYQLLEARTRGADAVLLIHALLGEIELERLFTLAKQLSLTPLVEVHTERELRSAIALGAQLIGVNNRNLETLQVDLSTSVQLAKIKRPAHVCLISESGIETAMQIRELSSLGFDAFLIGTKLTMQRTPEKSLRQLLAVAQ